MRPTLDDHLTGSEKPIKNNFWTIWSWWSNRWLSYNLGMGCFSLLLITIVSWDLIMKDFSFIFLAEFLALLTFNGAFLFLFGIDFLVSKFSKWCFDDASQIQFFAGACLLGFFLLLGAVFGLDFTYRMMSEPPFTY